MSDSFSLRPLQASDRDAVRRLWIDRFGGVEEKVDNWMDGVLNERYRTFGHAAVADSPAEDDPVADGSGDAGDGPNGPVVGFGVLEIGSADYTRSYLSVEDLDLDLEIDEYNGIMHMYCVDRDWEGRGVGTALYRRHLQYFAEKGLAHAFGISWHRPARGGADSRALFEKTDFEAAGTFEEFYHRTSPREHCPDCGGECHCTATIYVKRLAGEGS